MKQISQLFILIVLLLAGTNLDAQTQFTVDQNYTFTPPGGCSRGRPTHTGQTSSTIVSVTANTTHNICLQGAPNLASNINNQCNRYYKFYIYKETSQLVFLEAVITKNDKWLQGATGPCSTGSTNISLTAQDLINAGVTAGKKSVNLRVEYDYFGNSSHTFDLNVEANGSPKCSVQDLESQSGNWGCWIGKVGCFDWYPCQVDINVSGYVELVQVSDGNQTYTIPRYTYSSNPIGGSGNYTFEWSLSGGPTNTSSNYNFIFYGSQSLTGVNLILTDNESGCVYYYNQPLKRSGMEAEVGSSMDLHVAPHPISGSGSFRVNYDLPEAGRSDIGLYDMTGKLVWRLADGLDGQMGENTLNLTAPGLAPGIYMLRMNTGSRTMTKKLVVQ